MTLLNGKGLEAAAGGVLYTLSNALPAKIAALNATESATVFMTKAGSYVFSVDSTLILQAPHTAAAVTVTIPAGTYTASQLVTLLMAEAVFTGADLEATTWGSSSEFLIIRIATKGTNCSIKVGAGTANTALGISNGQTYFYYALANPAHYVIADVEDVPISLSPPTVVAMCDNVDLSGDERDHSVTIRFHFANPITGAGVSAGLMWMADRYCQLALEVIEDAPTFHGAVVSASVVGIDYQTYERDNMLRGAADLRLDVQLEEE